MKLFKVGAFEFLKPKRKSIEIFYTTKTRTPDYLKK